MHKGEYGSTVVRFIGGPLDGEVRAVQGDPPPATYTVDVLFGRSVIYRLRWGKLTDDRNGWWYEA